MRGRILRPLLGLLFGISLEAVQAFMTFPSVLPRPLQMALKGKCTTKLSPNKDHARLRRGILPLMMAPPVVEEGQAQEKGGGEQVLLWAEGLAKTYDGQKYQFKDASFVLKRGERVGLIGVNGVGVCLPPICYSYDWHRLFANCVFRDSMCTHLRMKGEMA